MVLLVGDQVRVPGNVFLSKTGKITFQQHSKTSLARGNPLTKTLPSTPHHLFLFLYFGFLLLLRLQSVPKWPSSSPHSTRIWLVFLIFPCSTDLLSISCTTAFEKDSVILAHCAITIFLFSICISSFVLSVLNWTVRVQYCLFRCSFCLIWTLSHKYRKFSTFPHINSVLCFSACTNFHVWSKLSRAIVHSLWQAQNQAWLHIELWAPISEKSEPFEICLLQVSRVLVLYHRIVQWRARTWIFGKRSGTVMISSFVCLESRVPVVAESEMRGFDFRALKRYDFKPYYIFWKLWCVPSLESNKILVITFSRWVIIAQRLEESLFFRSKITLFLFERNSEREKCSLRGSCAIYGRSYTQRPHT